MDDHASPPPDDGSRDLRPVLARWEDAGGLWRVVLSGPSRVTVALLRCDGGEEVDRITTDHPDSVRDLSRRRSG